MSRELYPNFIGGTNVARWDQGRRWGNLGLSAGQLNPDTFSPTVGVSAGRTLLRGDAGSIGVTAQLGGSFVQDTNTTEGMLQYSSISPGAGVRGVVYPSPWLGLSGNLTGSYSHVHLWGEGRGPDAFWVESGMGILLGKPDALQGGLAWQTMSFVSREESDTMHAIQATVSMSWQRPER
jgi:hypothetical protein